jgi:hypothetical protein
MDSMRDKGRYILNALWPRTKRGIAVLSLAKWGMLWDIRKVCDSALGFTMDLQVLRRALET